MGETGLEIRLGRPASCCGSLGSSKVGQSGTKEVAKRLEPGNDRVLSVGEQQLLALPHGS